MTTERDRIPEITREAIDGPPVAISAPGLALVKLEVELGLSLPLLDIRVDVAVGPSLRPSMRISRGAGARRRGPGSLGRLHGRSIPHGGPPAGIRQVWRAPSRPASCRAGDPMVRTPMALAQPTCWLCRIQTRRASEVGHGSGFLLALPDQEGVVVATAAHLLWQAEEVVIFPAASATTAPFGALRADPTQLRLCAGWRPHINPMLDHGAVLLPRGPIAALLGGLALWELPDPAIPGLELTVAGYPGVENPFGDPWVTSGPSPGVAEGGAALAFHQPTAAGAEGGPLLARGPDGRWCAVGLQTGAGVLPHGLRFGAPVVADYLRWAREGR